MKGAHRLDGAPRRFLYDACQSPRKTAGADGRMTFADNTPPSQNEFIAFEFDLAHSPKKVWRALTEPVLLEQWLLPVIAHRGLKLEPGQPSRLRRCPGAVGTASRIARRQIARTESWLSRSPGGEFGGLTPPDAPAIPARLRANALLLGVVRPRRRVALRASTKSRVTRIAIPRATPRTAMGANGPKNSPALSAGAIVGKAAGIIAR